MRSARSRAPGQRTPCRVGCGILVPEQFGFRRNPELIRLHAEKKLENPKLAGAITVRIFFALVAVPDGRVCGACAKLFNAGFNPSVCPGRILGSEKGTSHKFFLDAEAFNSWWHQQREAARRGAMQKDDRLLAFVRAMLAGQRIEFSTHKFEGGVQLTECTVHHNAPDLCQCGGWHDWSLMPAVVQDGKRAFGYGPACAEKVRELLGEDPFETMLSVAIDDIKRASRPAEPRVAVIRAPTYLRLLSNLSRDPHPDGYVTSYTGGKVGGKSAAKRLRAEEQRKAALVHKPGGKKKAKK